MNEQDWCPECWAPQTVVDTHTETDVQTIYGTGPEYLAVDLACGDSLSVRTER